MIFRRPTFCPSLPSSCPRPTDFPRRTTAATRRGLEGAVGRLRGCGSGRAHVRENMSISSPRRRDRGVYVLPFTDERARADVRLWSPVATPASVVEQHSYALPVSPRLLPAAAHILSLRQRHKPYVRTAHIRFVPVERNASSWCHGMLPPPPLRSEWNDLSSLSLDRHCRR